ncbi:MAG: hypothetical protein HYZ75_02920 [Elusimicrobia bacterium]|nr:hypothetical protein [Elusimicrobiota bacterium]
MYRQLDPEKIIETAERLRARIRERFPDSSLSRLAAELVEVARNARERSAEIGRPHWPLRAGVGLFAAAVLSALAYGLSQVELEWRLPDVITLVQAVEAGTNELVLAGAAVYFLLSVEKRLKRGRALAALHELRSLAHVVDMHQLTKDPERLLRPGPDTASSPKVSMTAFELARYLDYCSEVLAVIGKVAAVYAQNFDEEAALSAVDEVEDLTTGLSRKIWQKLMILDADLRRADATSAPALPAA